MSQLPDLSIPLVLDDDPRELLLYAQLKEMQEGLQQDVADLLAVQTVYRVEQTVGHARNLDIIILDGAAVVCRLHVDGLEQGATVHVHIERWIAGSRIHWAPSPKLSNMGTLSGATSVDKSSVCSTRDRGGSAMHLDFPLERLPEQAPDLDLGKAGPRGSCDVLVIHACHDERFVV